jgi:hypothetical protein
VSIDKSTFNDAIELLKKSGADGILVFDTTAPDGAKTLRVWLNDTAREAVCAAADACDEVMCWESTVSDRGTWGTH